MGSCHGLLWDASPDPGDPSVVVAAGVVEGAVGLVVGIGEVDREGLGSVFVGIVAAWDMDESMWV